MRYVRDCRHVLATSQGEDEPGKALRRHSRGDGLSSPWGGVVALPRSPCSLTLFHSYFHSPAESKRPPFPTPPPSPLRNPGLGLSLCIPSLSSTLVLFDKIPPNQHLHPLLSFPLKFDSPCV